MGQDVTYGIKGDMPNACVKMDSMYRYQRYIYDATRKYYLLGRDRMLELMAVRRDDAVLEIGCGTGRNLKVLANSYPLANFYGLDASSVMLDAARKKLEVAKLSNITLKLALADQYSYATTFGMKQAFDTIFFSYSISMIPTWKDAIINAMNNVRPGGAIHIVDFYDQKRLPVAFRSALRTWLNQFDVHFWEDLMPFLKRLECQGLGMLDVTPVARNYAFIARFQIHGSMLHNPIPNR